jgi:hypothetical protein
VDIVKGADRGAVPADSDTVELPLLAFDGATFQVPVTATEGGGATPNGALHAAKVVVDEVVSSRVALGITPEGRVVFARGEVTPEVLREALLQAGCTRAVALDRGAHATGAYFRAGKPETTMPNGDETILYALATPMKPRGFRFEARTAAPLAAGGR